jgi:hypothetical protein
MSFFKRILKEPEPVVPETPRIERRSVPRFAISPQFPLKAVLSFVARDESGAPMSNTRHGWNWKGRLIECSELGARMQLGPGIRAEPAENCDLKLSVQAYEITVPCHVANISEPPEGTVLGLVHDLTDAAVRRDYLQLLEVVALGSTLKLQPKADKPDASGYLVEVYASGRPSRLTVWRHPANASVAAFEFQLKDNLVRAAAGHGVEFLADIAGTGSRPASNDQCLEIGRLFTWVVPNLAAAVPKDVRAFLQHYAT